MLDLTFTLNQEEDLVLANADQREENFTMNGATDLYLDIEFSTYPIDMV